MTKPSWWSWVQYQGEIVDTVDLILSHKCPRDTLVSKPGLGLCLGLRRLMERAGVTKECRQTLSLYSCVRMILPLTVLGRLSLNSTILGYL